ncbi:aspartate aminotransferase family protein [Halobacterium sp. KA-6]|uniref:aspartate aminotransferase family protein n=1 Tax=Halobacterium sp. KA-6 TaxID=2896368 RepID=UPI001E35637C|nr:aspartate aminotransferase family protein [Halobacterium sp. KA-6]MCD2204580.1 aspartate aminotransferase family protein [Halobacterium sp. KA-6]
MSKEQSTPVGNAAIKDQYEQYLMPIWKSLDVPIKRAEGCTVEDFDGNEYLDVFSGISVTNAGHREETIVEAAKDQLDEFIHGCTYLHPHQPAADLAEKLAEVTPGGLQKTFFANSGTEAVEGAVKLARKYTSSKEVIALEMSFHGRTLGSLSLTGNKAYKDEMAPTLNDVAHVAPPYSYRCPRCDGDSCTADCANQLERIIETHTSGDIAAVIVEPIMGEGGIIVPPEGWLERIQEITHQHGGLLIVDEVQTGYGRTGEMWASDHFDVVPDIMPQAKGIANGLPLGAFTARKEIADAFESGDHLSTFGGNPVACAAAQATINELQDGLVANAREQGIWLNDRLADLEASYEVVGNTRGLGLMQGVELVDPSESGPMGVAPAPDAKLAKHVGNQLREDGIVMGVGGFYSNVLRFQPPLPISREQLERTVTAIEDALDQEAP